MHLYAPRAQLLHLNPSHRPVLQFQRAAGVRTACSPGAVPVATAPHPQHCRPLVSTCLFFSNPRFLPNYSQMELKLPGSVNHLPCSVLEDYSGPSRCTGQWRPSLQNFNKAHT